MTPPSRDSHAATFSSPYAGFDSLMARRVQDILVVASPYDAFVLEEGGRLTELIINEYVRYNLSFAPSVTRVSTAEEALQALETKRFDMVFTMLWAGVTDAFSFAQRVKQVDDSIPVVVMAFDARELNRLLETTSDDDVDFMCTWSGDARLFLAMIKLQEDEWNVDHDTQTASVRTILLIEDSARFASIYLPLLYTELVKQTQSLMDDGANLTQRMLRQRARPKVLLARTYEDAHRLYEHYKRYLLGVITDLEFPRQGKLDHRAGLRFAKGVRDDDATMPLLLQSSDSAVAEVAEQIQAQHLNKRSPRLLRHLRRFITQNFGFGEFVFRLPDGTEIARASNLRELERTLRDAPAESIEYHANRNHFSNWLRARTEFDLASQLRPKRVSEFENLEELRSFLSESLRAHRVALQRGMVVDYTPSQLEDGSGFVRIGGGSLGGKGRGLAFANSLLLQAGATDRFEDVRIEVPRTAVVGTDVFDEFLESNQLRDVAFTAPTFEEVAATFLQARLPEAIEDDLASFVQRVRYPLAVRSSSILEDSQTQPFAGVYRTYMVPNSHEDAALRQHQLRAAIKLVYASLFSPESRAYVENSPFLLEDEKMAVILQEVVGARHEERYYPSVCGVVRSYNFYPVEPMEAEDGVAVIALGMGRQVVTGCEALRFSPVHPQALPQFGSVKDTLQGTQKEFYALDLSHPERLPDYDDGANLLRLPVDQALKDGVLGQLASGYSTENNVLYDALRRGTRPVLTFAPILKQNTVPLAEVLRYLVELGRLGMGGPVEIEFALDLTSQPARLGFLQIRRMVMGSESDDVRIDDESLRRAVCTSSQVMGNGILDDIQDVVYVHPGRFRRDHSREAAEQLGQLTSALRQSKRPYILMGPGRWGSADPWLGIPVGWQQIAGASVIVETSFNDMRVTPSQGTHFFQNITAMRLGYFTVSPGSPGDRVRWEWLDEMPVVAETVFVRHARSPRPLRVSMDGQTGIGVIHLRPSPEGNKA